MRQDLLVGQGRLARLRKRLANHPWVNYGIFMATFYMMYVAGTARPKKVHATLESAREAVKAYKEQGGTRECFILAPIETFAGRKILTIKPKVTVEARAL
jgi:hypothetical protein